MDTKRIIDILESIKIEKDKKELYKIISTFLGNQTAAKEFDNYRSNITSDQFQLLNMFYEYEYEYFDDMMLSENSLMGDIAEIVSENYDYLPLGLEYANIRIYHVDTSNFQGCFYPYERKIEIQAGLEPEIEKSVILHEMIHFYEWQLQNTFPVAKELLTVRLYNDLSKSVDNFENLIYRHCNLFEQEETFVESSSGIHGLLFYLKSLELDIRCGYPLGTVCGYSRNEWE